MALVEGQIQIRGLVLGPDTPYLVRAFNAYRITARADQSGQRAWSHGSWSGAEWADEVAIDLNILVEGEGAAGWAEANDALAAALAPVGADAEGVELRWVLGGREYLRLVRPRVFEPDSVRLASGQVATVAGLVALDPLRYSGQESTATVGLPEFTGGLTLPVTPPFMIAASLSEGVAVLENQGKADTPLRLRVDGPVAQPRVVVVPGTEPVWHRYAWTGTPHQSTSTRTLDYLDGTETLTNLVTNPRGRNTSGTVVVRENLAWLDGWGGSGTVSGGYPDGVTLTNDTGTTAWTGILPIAMGGDYYGIRIQVRNVDKIAGSTVRCQFNVSSSVGANIALPAPGGAVEITLPGEFRDESDLRAQVVASNSGSIIIERVLVERTPEGVDPGPLLDPDDDLAWQWTDTPGESVSQLTGPAPVGWSSYAGSILYYSASQDALACRQVADTSLGSYVRANPGDGEAGTFVVEAMAPEAGTIYLRTGSNVDSPTTGPTVDLTPGQWQTLHLGGTSTGGNGPSWNMHPTGDIGTTVYFRAAVIDGTDTYAGPVFDGHTPDEQVGGGYTGPPQTLSIDTTLQTGQWLDIDTGDRTVLLQGQTSRRAQTAGEFPLLGPGKSTLRLFAAEHNDTAEATAKWRSAWW